MHLFCGHPIHKIISLELKCYYVAKFASQASVPSMLNKLNWESLEKRRSKSGVAEKEAPALVK